MGRVSELHARLLDDRAAFALEGASAARHLAGRAPASTRDELARKLPSEDWEEA